MKIKSQKMWALDGSYYTEQLDTIRKTVDIIDGKEFYTICDSNNTPIALAVIRFN